MADPVRVVELRGRRIENTILHWADYTFWRVVEAGGQFADSDPWLKDA